MTKKEKGQNNKQWFTKHYTENRRLNETNQTKPSMKQFLRDEKSLINITYDDEKEFLNGFMLCLD
jgi:hypothetical protein